MSNFDIPFNDRDDESLDSLRDLEDQLFDLADDVPVMRSSMRAEYLSELAVIEYRRRQLARVPVVVALLLTFTASIIWTQVNIGAEFFVAKPTDQDHAWMAQRDSDDSDDSNRVVVANSSDSWGLVDAYAEQRTQKIRSIRQRLGVVAQVTSHQ